MPQYGKSFWPVILIIYRQR